MAAAATGAAPAASAPAAAAAAPAALMELSAAQRAGLAVLKRYLSRASAVEWMHYAAARDAAFRAAAAAAATEEGAVAAASKPPGAAVQPTTVPVPRPVPPSEVHTNTAPVRVWSRELHRHYRRRDTTTSTSTTTDDADTARLRANADDALRRDAMHWFVRVLLLITTATPRPRFVHLTDDELKALTTADGEDDAAVAVAAAARPPPPPSPPPRSTEVVPEWEGAEPEWPGDGRALPDWYLFWLNGYPPVAAADAAWAHHGHGTTTTTTPTPDDDDEPWKPTPAGFLLTLGAAGGPAAYDRADAVMGALDTPPRLVEVDAADMFVATADIHEPPLRGAVARVPWLAHALLDLPPDPLLQGGGDALNVDIAAPDDDGRRSLFYLCVRPAAGGVHAADVPLLARLLPRFAKNTLRVRACTSGYDEWRPADSALHVLLDRIRAKSSPRKQYRMTRHALHVLALVCALAIRDDGSGLDLTEPNAAGESLEAVLRRGPAPCTAGDDDDGDDDGGIEWTTADADAHLALWAQAVATVRSAQERVRAYPPKLSAALRDSAADALPAPVLAIVSDYVLWR